MLHGAILYSGAPDESFFDSLHGVRQVKWESVVTTSNRKNWAIVEELLPTHCNLVVILDPSFTSFPFLASLVRKGCHLFLPERQMMNSAERMKLIELAEEGNTFIHIRNDLLFHPSFLAEGMNGTSSKLIELHQVAPKSPELLQEMLYHNLLMVLRMVDSEPSRISVCSIPNSGYPPDVVNLHLNFHSGSAASLTFSFHGKKKEHLLSVHDANGVVNYNFLEKKADTSILKTATADSSLINNHLLFKQIAYFSNCILERGYHRYGLNDEAKTLRLLEKINQKLEFRAEEVNTSA